MNRLNRSKMLEAVSHLIAAQVLIDEVVKSPESPSNSFDRKEGVYSLFHLEDARAAVCGFLKDAGVEGLPVGDPPRAARPPAGTGSRRTGGIFRN